MGYRYKTQREDFPASAVALPPLDANGMVYMPCGRCSDKGNINAYRHVAGGVCFDCNGQRGYQLTPTEYQDQVSYQQYQDARAEERRLQRLARRERKITKLCQAHPVLAMLTYPEMLDPESRFFASVSEALRFHPEHFSEAQVDAAVKALTEQPAREQERADRAAAEEAARRPAPEGTVVVRGTITHTKIQEDHYGYHPTTSYKMLVQCPTDDGGHFLVWSTIPAKIRDASEFTVPGMKGAEVEFTATLTRGREEHFALAKRPTRGVLVADAPRGE